MERIDRLRFAERVKAQSPGLREYLKQHHLTPEQYQRIEDKDKRTSLLPFPLGDGYKNKADVRLPGDALDAVGSYRYVLGRFGPDPHQDKSQLKHASDVARDIRLAWSAEYELELAEVPLAEDSERPTDEDFARLEQWFLTAANAIKKEIAREDGAGENPTRGRKKRRARLAENRKARSVTAKETEALQLFGELKGNISAIAKRLGRDPKTIRERLESAHRKLGETGWRNRTKAGRFKAGKLPEDNRGNVTVATDDHGPASTR